MAAFLEKYRIAVQESKISLGVLINLQDQINATTPLINGGKPNWMIGMPQLPALILRKQIISRDVEIKNLSDSINTFDHILKSLNALLKDALAKINDTASDKSIAPLEILQWIEDSYYSILKETEVQKKILNAYIIGEMPLEVMAERWDACELVDFGIEGEIKKRLKYFKF